MGVAAPAGPVVAVAGWAGDPGQAAPSGWSGGGDRAAGWMEYINTLMLLLDIQVEVAWL